MTSSQTPGLYQCDDFLQFQIALRDARLIDDKIVYALNTTIPTASFKAQINSTEKCRDLYTQITETYDMREKALNHCIAQTQEILTSAKAKGASGEIRPLQLSLRLYRNELSVEEVIRSRTESIFHEKCRDHFTPSLP